MVTISLTDAKGSVKGSLEIESGDGLRLVADSHVRLGHLSVGASLLAEALGCKLETSVSTPLTNDFNAASEFSASFTPEPDQPESEDSNGAGEGE